MAATSEDRVLVKNALSTAYSLKFMSIDKKKVIAKFYAYILDDKEVPNLLISDASILLSKPVLSTLFFERSASYIKEIAEENQKFAKVMSKTANLSDSLSNLNSHARQLGIPKVSEQITYSKILSAVNSIEGHLNNVVKAELEELNKQIEESTEYTNNFVKDLFGSDNYTLEENGQNVDGVTAEDLLSASDFSLVDNPEDLEGLEIEGIDLSSLESNTDLNVFNTDASAYTELSEDDLTEEELEELEELEREEELQRQLAEQMQLENLEQAEEEESWNEKEQAEPEPDFVEEEQTEFNLIKEEEQAETEHEQEQSWNEEEIEKAFEQQNKAEQQKVEQEQSKSEQKQEETKTEQKKENQKQEDSDKSLEDRKALIKREFDENIATTVKTILETFERLYQSAYSPILPGGILTNSGFVECDIDGKADGAEQYDENKYYNEVLNNRVKLSDVSTSDAANILKAIREAFGDAYDYVQDPGAEPNIHKILEARRSGKVLIYPSVHLKAMYGALNFCLGRTTGLRHYLHSINNTDYDTKTKVSQWEIMKSWLRGYLTNICVKALLDINIDKTSSNLDISSKNDAANNILGAVQESLKQVIVVSDFKKRVNTKIKISTGKTNINLYGLINYLKSSFNLGNSDTIKVEKIGSIQNSVLEINIIKNKKAFSQSELFAYQVLPELQKQHMVPSWTNIILGQDDNGIFTKALTGDTAVAINLYAGMGSGKGVMTLNLICAALADKAELMYVDAKPDSSLALTKAAWSRGVDVAVINGMEISGSLIDMTGIAPPRDVKDTDYQANIPEGIFTALTDEAGKESGLGEKSAARAKRDFLLFVQYLKAFEFYIQYCVYRAQHLYSERGDVPALVVIFDELQQLCRLEINYIQQLEDILAKIKKETVEVNGKSQKIDCSKDPRYIFITNFFAWLENLKTSATSATKSTLRKAKTTGIYIWQTSKFPSEYANKSVIASFLMNLSTSSLKCVGYGGPQAGGSTVFGTPSTLATAKVEWYERVNQKGMGYWAIGDNVNNDGDKGMHVFKPYKVFSSPANKELLLRNAASNGLTEEDLIGSSLNPDGSVVQETGFEAYATKLLALAGLDLGQQLTFGLQKANEYVQETGLGKNFFDVIYRLDFSSTIRVEADALEDGRKVDGYNTDTEEKEAEGFSYSKLTNKENQESNSDSEQQSEQQTSTPSEPFSSAAYNDETTNQQSSQPINFTKETNTSNNNSTTSNTSNAEEFNEFSNLNNEENFNTNSNTSNYSNNNNYSDSYKNFNTTSNTNVGNFNNFTDTEQSNSRQYTNNQSFNNNGFGQEAINRASQYKTNILNKPMKCKTFASLSPEEQEANINRVIAELTKPFDVKNRETRPFGLIHLCWDISILFYSKMLDVNQLIPEMKAFASNYAERLKSRHYPLDYIPSEEEVKGLMIFMDTTIENGAFRKREMFNNMHNEDEELSNKDIYAEAYKQHAKFEELRHNVKSAYSVGVNGRNNINLEALKIKPILLNNKNSVDVNNTWYNNLWQKSLLKSNTGVSYLFNNRTNCVIDSILKAIPDKKAVTRIAAQDYILTVNNRLVDTDSLIDDSYGIRFEDFVNIKKILKVFRHVQMLSIDYRMYLQVINDYGADVQNIWEIFQDNTSLMQLEVQLNPGTPYSTLTKQNYKEHLAEIQEAANLAKLKAGMEQMSAKLNPRIEDKGIGYRQENGVSEKWIQRMSKGSNAGKNIGKMGGNLIFTEKAEDFHPIRGAFYGLGGLSLWALSGVISSPFRAWNYIKRMSS